MLSPRIPDLSALEMLAAVHDLGSLSAAGKHLGLSQQAVSSRMRSLESQIGSVLLTRTPRGSTLTESGALVAGWAAEVLAAAERLDAGIASLRSDTARQLKVAASQTIAEHLLPLWLVALRRQQESLGLVPTVVELTVNNSEATVALVRSGQAAIGFIESPHLPPGPERSGGTERLHGRGRRPGPPLGPAPDPRHSSRTGYNRAGHPGTRQRNPGRPRTPAHHRRDPAPGRSAGGTLHDSCRPLRHRSRHSPRSTQRTGRPRRPRPATAHRRSRPRATPAPHPDRPLADRPHTTARPGP